MASRFRGAVLVVTVKRGPATHKRLLKNYFRLALMRELPRSTLIGRAPRSGSCGRADLVENILHRATNFNSTLFGVGPRRQWRCVRIDHGQRFLGVLARQRLLSHL